MLGFGSTLEAFPFYQLEKMLVLSGGGLLLKIHNIIKRNKYKS